MPRNGEWRTANGKSVFNANNAYDTTPGAVNQNGEVKTIDRVAWYGVALFVYRVRAHLFVLPLFINLFIFRWNIA